MPSQQPGGRRRAVGDIEENVDTEKSFEELRSRLQDLYDATFPGGPPRKQDDPQDPLSSGLQTSLRQLKRLEVELANRASEARQSRNPPRNTANSSGSDRPPPIGYRMFDRHKRAFNVLPTFSEHSESEVATSPTASAAASAVALSVASSAWTPFKGADPALKPFSLARVSFTGWMTRLFVFIFSTAIFWRCINYDEWYIDEPFAITRNADAKGETDFWQMLQHDFWGQHMWTDGQWTHKSYRPLCTLSYIMQFWMTGWEIHPWSLRAASCLLHGFTSVLVGDTVERYFELPTMTAWLASIYFAFHPVHTENVVYLVGRADMMATTFMVLAMRLYLRWSGSILGFLGLVFLAILSGLSKETGFTVMVHLGAMAWLGRSIRVPRYIARGAILFLAFFVIIGVRSWYVGGTSVGFSYVDTPIRYQNSTVTRGLSYAHQHSYYAQIMVFPWNLSWDYSYDSLPLLTTFADLRILAILVAYNTTFILCFRAALQDRSQVQCSNFAVMAGMALVLIPWVVFSNVFFLVGTTIGERLLYPSTVGWTLVLAGLGSRFTKARRPLYHGFLLVIILVFIYRTNMRVGQWETRQTLFIADAQHWHRYINSANYEIPRKDNSAKVLHQYATTLHARGRREEALDVYEKALAVFDDNAVTDYCIARIYLETDRCEDSFNRFQKIWNGHGIGFGDHNDFVLYLDYGYSLVCLGKYEESLGILQKGMETQQPPYAVNALAFSLAHLGKLDEALNFLLQMDPDPIVYNNIGAIAMLGNAPEPARDALAQALEIDPGDQRIIQNAQRLQHFVQNGQWPSPPEMHLFFG